MRSLAAWVLLLTAMGPARAAGPPLPPRVASALPRGLHVLATAHVLAAETHRSFYVVALAQARENRDSNPPRPLLIVEDLPDGARVAGRNDTVVGRIGDGGQCDPFLDGGGTLTVKGSYFTIENGVACGTHWTDYITFHFDAKTGGFLFSNERSASWSMNRSDDPNAEALVPDGPPTVVRANPDRPVAFSAWRPSR